METIDTLRLATEVPPVVMQTYNSVLIISILIMHAVLILFLSIVFIVTRNKQTQKLFLPLLISLVILSYPIFSALNLWPISWLPQLESWYDLQMQLECYYTTFDAFSLFYWKWVPYAITMIYCVLVVFFIQYLYKQDYFTKLQRFLLFVPFVNHFLIVRYLFQLNISVLSKIISILCILISCIHWFYRTIGLVLLMYGIDFYTWYFNTFLGTSIEYPIDGSASHYTLFNDYLFHFNMSLTFVSALFMFPVYFILNKLNPVFVTKEGMDKNIETE